VRRREPLATAAVQPASFRPRDQVRVIVGSAQTIGKSRLQTSGVPFYLLVWMSFPIFNLLLIALIYRDDPALRNYAIIGGAGMTMLFGMQFNAGEILDHQRYRGTLANLFVCPAPRYSWLGGYQLFAATEALTIALVNVAVAKAIFGLPLHIRADTLVLTLALFLAAMWGFSMVIGAVGLAVRNANQLSNLVFPIMQLVAGTMYPIALMPDWIRLPARCLPFGYAISALADSVTHGATIPDVSGQLLPLTGFAIGLPLLGIVAFRAVERRTRRSGALELV
jgi:ABC-2 type transport system permease protein